MLCRSSDGKLTTYLDDGFLLAPISEMMMDPVRTKSTPIKICHRSWHIPERPFILFHLYISIKTEIAICFSGGQGSQWLWDHG